MTAEPKREYTEPMRCDDCRTETTHLVIVWSFSTTAECAECGVITELGEQ